MLIYLAVLVSICEVANAAVEGSEWIGKTFPSSNSNSVQEGFNEVETHSGLDHHGRIRMGVKNAHCDWGDDPEGFDGDLGPQSYVCFQEKIDFRPNPNRHPLLRKYPIPKSYVPGHRCMNESIIYKNLIPTYGDHRPLWAKYGEYSFLPKQRWIHNLEHGSIVMLYHPCADPNEVAILRKIVKGCLYQYVISANNELYKLRPLALVAWGTSLQMSKVDPKTVVDFIRNFSFKAPETIALDGQYDKNLLEAADPHNPGVTNICPNH